MRRILTPLAPVLLLIFAAPAMSQPYGPPPPPDRVPNLNGTWFNSGDQNQPCYVQMRPDGSARFTNEKGDSARGEVRPDRVIIPDWGGEEGLPGLVGRIRGDRIVWPDGNYWSREPR